MSSIWMYFCKMSLLHCAVFITQVASLEVAIETMIEDSHLKIVFADICFCYLHRHPELWELL